MFEQRRQTWKNILSETFKKFEKHNQKGKTSTGANVSRVWQNLL